MLPILLALFLNFNAGQMQSDYKENVFTHVITNEADAQKFAHGASDRTLESANVITITLPPKIRYSHETIRLKPTLTDISLPTVTDYIHTMPNDIEKTVHTETTNAFDIAAPPPKIQLNINGEVKLRPKISDVFPHTVNGVTQEADWDITHGTNVDGSNREGSLNVIKVAAPPPKIQLNVEHETIKLQPKISDVIVHTINGITEEAIQGKAPGADFQGVGEPSLHNGQSSTVIKIPTPSQYILQSPTVIKTATPLPYSEQSPTVIKIPTPSQYILQSPTVIKTATPPPYSEQSPTVIKIPTPSQYILQSPTVINTATPPPYSEQSPTVIKIPTPSQYILQSPTVINTSTPPPYSEQSPTVIKIPTPSQYILRSPTVINTATPPPYSKQSPTVINIAEPPQKLQLNITDETINLKPTISNVFSQTVDETTQKENRPNTAATGPEVTYERPEIENPIETQPQTFEEPVNDEYNYDQVTEQPAKIENQVKPDVNALNQPINDGYRVKPVEPVVGVDRKPIDNNRMRAPVHQQKVTKPPHKPAHKKGAKSPAHAHGKHKKPVKKTHKAHSLPVDMKPPYSKGNPRTKTVNVNIKGKKSTNKERIQGTDEENPFDEKFADVITTAAAPSKIDLKYVHERILLKPELVNLKPEVSIVQTQPQTIRIPINVAYKLNQIAEGQSEFGAQNKPDIYKVNHPTIVNYNVKSTIPDVHVDRKTKVIHSGSHVPKHGRKVITSAPKRPHKKGTKRPTHLNKVPKHKKPMKKPHKAYNIRVEEHTKIRVYGRKHSSRPIKKHGRKVITSAPKRPHKKGTKRPTHLPKVPKHKKPMKKPHKVYNVRVEEHTKIRVYGRNPSSRPIKKKHQKRLEKLTIKMKRNRDRHPHLSMPKKVNTNKMKQASSQLSKCMCKICRQKLARMNKPTGLKLKINHSGRMRISGRKNDRKPAPKSAHVQIFKRPALKILHEKRVEKPVIHKAHAMPGRKHGHNIRIIGHQKVNFHVKPKKPSPRPVKVIHRVKTVKVNSKPKIVRHPNKSAHKRVRGKVRQTPSRKPVISACGCKLRMKRHILSHKASYSGSESGIFHANPAASVSVDPRPKRDFAGRLQVPAPPKFMYSKIGDTLSQSHKSRRYRLSGEIKPSDSSHNGTNIAAGDNLQFDNWQRFGRCDYMVKRNAGTYDDAETACQTLDAHLASIHSEKENKFIHEITSNGNRVKSFEDFVWIGLRMNSQNQWEWVDKSPLDYHKWAANQPDHPDEERCAQFYQGPANLTYVQEYHWNSFRCDMPMNYFVCKRCTRPVRVREQQG